MADVNRGNRPLSPHLTVWKWDIGMATSILTRITGNGLIVAMLLAVWWLLAAASGPDYFDTVNWIATSWLGILIWVGSLWAIWYHTLAGIRHLIWDTATALDLKTAHMLGWVCVGGSLVLTLLTLLLI